MEQSNKSNRMIYAENRERYYDKVVSMFESGMLAKEIVKIVPIGKSTVYRWYDEYVASNKEADVRKSPKNAAATIKQLKQRIEQLEAICSVGDECVVMEKNVLSDFVADIYNIGKNLVEVANQLSALSVKLSKKL